MWPLENVKARRSSVLLSDSAGLAGPLPAFSSSGSLMRLVGWACPCPVPGETSGASEHPKPMFGPAAFQNAPGLKLHPRKPPWEGKSRNLFLSISWSHPAPPTPPRLRPTMQLHFCVYQSHSPSRSTMLVLNPGS